MKSARWVVSILPIVLFAVPSAPARGEQPAPRTANSPRQALARNAPEWGTTDRIWYHVGYQEFSPRSSSVTYNQDVGRYSTILNGNFGAALHLPSGALLTRAEMNYCDTSPTSAVIMNLLQCPFTGSPCEFLGGVLASTGPSGCAFVAIDLTPLNTVIDNNTYFYEIEGVTGSGDNTTQIVGAYVGYKLQVSPAPASATFADVPTGHQQFRFVEALFAAGITAGCGGGNFCPDAPITRGQMAVFLSAALGLHFPN